MFIENLRMQGRLNSHFKVSGWPHNNLVARFALPEMSNSIFKAFSACWEFLNSFIEVLIAFLDWNKNKRSLPTSTYTTREATFEQPSSDLCKSKCIKGGYRLLAREVNNVQLSSIVIKSCNLNVSKGPDLAKFFWQEIQSNLIQK